jgi:pilus assembly protein FimV
VVASEPEFAAEVSAPPTADPLAAVPAATARRESPPLEDSGEVYGPVQRGDTLWVIAANFRRGTSYSINQAMLAIQRINPQAFVGGNINALRSGVMLRMPRLDQLATLSSREAFQEALRQEQEYRARRAGQPYERPPVLAAREPAGEAREPEATIDESPMDAELPSGRLELVPPEGADDIAAGPGGAEDSGAGDAAGGDRDGEVPSEEEIASMQQEQAYLEEQIRTLQAQAAAGEPGAGIEDTGLAELESALREERLAGEPEEPVAVVPPREKDRWYSGSAWWLVIPLVAVVALLVRALRRYRGARDAGVDASAEMAQRARPGGPDREDAAADGDGSAGGGGAGGEGQVSRAGDERHRVTRPPASPDEEAVELDANDPDTKLDLARAYLAMGQTDTARVLLEEVLATGDEAQVRKARNLLAGI